MKKDMNSCPATSSTIEALMYSLRKGVVALGRDDVQQRLGAVDEQQLRDICGRLQKFKVAIAKPWSTTEVEAIIMTWAACHG
jgi:hypothetical protein